jgi:arylsulfatase A-like enzyme
MDVTLRVDRQIGELLDFVNAKVGLANTLVAFTADHGVAPIPEHATALKLDGGRLNVTELVKKMRAAISAKYNPQGKMPDPTDDYIYKYQDENGSWRDAFYNSNLYFNYDALRRDGVNVDEIADVAGAAALTFPGIARYFTRSQLLRGEVSADDPIERRVLHGFNPARSGDLILIMQPYKFMGDLLTSTHGTPYSYDTHVPTIIMGPGVTAGRYLEPSSPADIAPTLAAVLRVTRPTNATGRVLIEALRK